MTEKARALDQARQALANGRPDDPVEISAIALTQLAHSIVQQQGEIESLMLDLDETRRRLLVATDVHALQSEGLSSGLKTEVMLLRHTLLRIGSEEWFATDREVMADGDRGCVATTRSEITAQYIACLDPRFVRALLAELARRRVASETPRDGA